MAKSDRFYDVITFSHLDQKCSSIFGFQYSNICSVSIQRQQISKMRFRYISSDMSALTSMAKNDSAVFIERKAIQIIWELEKETCPNLLDSIALHDGTRFIYGMVRYENS